MENESAKQRFPIGMILILLLIGHGVLSILRDTLNVPLFQIGPVILSGTGAIIIDLITVGILGVISYGILKRMKWSRKLATGWFTFTIALMMVNMISLLRNKAMYNGYYQKLLTPETYSMVNSDVITSLLVAGMIFGSISALIIVIYLARKKDFFVH